MKGQDAGSMNCDRVRDELPLLLYGELEPATAAAVEGHLASCAACRAEREAHRRTMRLLDQWPEPEPPALSQTQVPRAASPWSAGRGVLRFVRPVAVGAAAAVLAFGMLALLGANARYAQGQLVVTLGRGPASGHSSLIETSAGITASRVRELARTEYDRRFVGFLRLLREDLDGFNRSQEQSRLLLARAAHLQREEDQRMQVAALETLVRGFSQDSARQRQAIRHIYAMIEPGGVIPASYHESPGKD